MRLQDFSVLVEVTGKITRNKSATKDVSLRINECPPSKVIEAAETQVRAMWIEASGEEPETVRAMVIKPLVWEKE